MNCGIGTLAIPAGAAERHESPAKKNIPIVFHHHGDEGNHSTDGGRHVWVDGQLSATGRLDVTMRAENRVRVSPDYRFNARIFLRDVGGNLLWSADMPTLNVGGNLFDVGRGQTEQTFQVPEELLQQTADIVVIATGRDFFDFGRAIGDAIKAGAALVLAL